MELPRLNVTWFGFGKVRKGFLALMALEGEGKSRRGNFS